MRDKFEGPYRTAEEIDYLERMKADGKTELLTAYCGIILRGERRYDATVDAGEVRRWAAGWMGRA